ncbi:MAG: SDR family NAD(P)-dependent oxidoreductase [Streptosporangiaceae bacterium]|nr:SDR family NAD(P)-dependent oxidoreductase [Streptosporangiaceae bacterium]
MRHLAGKIAVVTGAASGIGLALSRRLGADGMSVMMADVEETALAAAAEELSAEGIEVAATVTDVSDAESVDALASATLRRFGAVHVLCNNAGVSRGGPAWDIPLSMWGWIAGVNLFGIVHGIRSFVPHLIAQREGHVVNTASMGGMLAGPWMSPYHATKYAAVAISESLYHELAAVGSPVRVSVLCPGMVRTRIHEAYRNWPARYGAWPVVHDSPAIAKWRQTASARVGAGHDPATIATAVRDAILREQFWILTHPEFGDALRDKYDGALEGRNPRLLPLPAFNRLTAALERAK